MKNILCLFSFLLATSSLSNAQAWSPLLKVDTLTTGEFNDCHPIVDHSSFMMGSEDNIWVVFDRQTDTESMIAAKKYNTNSEAWDTSVTTISSSPETEEQRFPEITTIPYSSSGRIMRRTVVVWQHKKDSVWNIYFSTVMNDSTNWSTPIPLTSGTSSSTGVRILPYYDSTFIVSWKNNNCILFSFLSPPKITPAETLAVSNFDSFDYDINFRYSTGGVIWTERDSAGQTLLLERYINTYPSFSLTEPAMLPVRGNISNPQFAFYPDQPYVPVLYESSLNGKHAIYVADGQDTTNLLHDPNADFRNARAYTLPEITKPLAKSCFYWFTLFVVERRTATDSSLLFDPSLIYTDTVRSPGHNRDACIGSSPIYLSQYNSEGVPVVWESNRSGRPHIYSRFVLTPLGDVREENNLARHFELSQNFPNPFNPSTTIRFQLSTTAAVTLKIFDVLGREMQTLIKQELTPGNYAATWDGTRFASGIYFYQLKAGDFVQTKKLLLLK